MTSVAEVRPDLAAEWSPRNPWPAREVKPQSDKKAWWIGAECGHEWQATVGNRVNGNTTCPYCANKRVLPGFNDLATRFPDVAAEWHPTKNETSPDQVMPGTKKKAWWLCGVCGREWAALVKFRTGKGSGCASCRGRIRGLKNPKGEFSDLLRSEWSPDNQHPIDHYPIRSNFKAKWECSKGHKWETQIQYRTGADTRCTWCNLSGTSRAEMAVAEFVKTLVPEVRTHHRQIDSRYEFDVTVPERKIAIEFNGLYWHSEKHKTRTYHADKTRAAQEAGWQVIHVWEDDWNLRRPVVEKMLARKLGVSQEPKLNARSLAVKQVSSATSREVLEENHIQGYVPGSVRLALVDAAGAVQALMVFRSRGDGVWELSRYATASIVRGGFSKLLKAFIRQNQPTKVVSFSDNTVSDGSLYEQLGFTRDADISPDYCYRVGAVREHKFNYRVNRFRTDPNLKFEEGLTERELAELNDLDRIYDAGKIRWVLTP